MASNQIEQYIQANPNVSGFDLHSKFPFVFQTVPIAQNALKEWKAKTAGVPTAVAVVVEEQNTVCVPLLGADGQARVEPEKFEKPETEIPQPDANGEFVSPVDGALWMAVVHHKRQLPLNGKIALLKEWEKNASADPDQIRKWAGEYPGCNFGSVADDGPIFEVDSLEVRKRFGQPFSQTLTVQSSEQKGHRYYLPADVEHIGQNAVKHGDFSLRKHNAYCVSPGSVHPQTGKQYRVVVNAPIIAPTHQEIAFWNSERIENKLSAAIAQQAQIPEGQRNSALTSTAGKLLDAGMTPEDVKQYIAKINQDRCIPSLSQAELEATVYKSIDKWSKKPDAITRQLTPSVLLDGNLVGQQELPPVVEVENEPINPSESVSNNSLDYLPSGCLASTRLQDIYMEYFQPHDWPLTLALPALVTAASVIVPPPRQDSLTIGDSMTNLYTALIADVNAGKSQVINWAATAIGIYEPPLGNFYFEGKFGSAEQMLKSLHRKQSHFVNKSVLINPDEWAHLFSKAAIPDASFPTVLTSSFYRRNQIFTLGGPGGGKEYNVNLAMSFISGIVESEFDTVFGANSLGGLYDRFLFGRAPDGFKWNYVPCPIEPKKYYLDWNLKPVQINGSVFEVLRSWGKQNPGLGRIAEVCSRVAAIYGCIDGRPEITGKDIEPLKPLALYQVGLRQIFRPNPGTTPDAIFANKALAWINKHGANWVSISRLKQHLYRVEERLGPNVAERALMSLARGGRIDLWLANGEDNPPSDYRGPRVKIGLVRRVR